MIERIGVQPVIVTASPAMARQSYRVTESGEDGAVSLEVSCSNDLSMPGNGNYLHWASDAAGPFKVERSTGGVFVEIASVEAQFYMDAG
ncbi:hypothetical protein [Sphingomonas sp. CCH9-E2]|uniref:hypothetical protein n=1 Tax=Sphingomonas sp. CCH9-E2 TaxID=1768776 RepID=UPI000833133C|nr:hypothetical protein [Sphingomonas sp. CCH9-E2]